MLKLLKVGLTGGLASGKSAVCLFFKQLGAYTVSADDIVHCLLSSPFTDLRYQVVALLGPEVADGLHFDRDAIAKKVFNDRQLLLSFESLLHAEVWKEVERQRLIAVEQQAPLFVVEVPLLFETGKETLFDVTIAVVTREELCKQRFLERGKHSLQEYERRMARQMSPQEKAKRATYIMKNEGSLKELKKSVIYIYHILKGESSLQC